MKAKIADELETLVNGVVVLGILDELAWNLFIDGKNCDTIRTLSCRLIVAAADLSLVEGYDFDILRQFQTLFPDLPLTALVKGYFAYAGVSRLEGEGEQSDQTPQTDLEDDPLDVILVCNHLISCILGS